MLHYYRRFNPHATQERVEREYLSAFPEMRGKYSFHLCQSADGIAHQAAGNQAAGTSTRVSLSGLRSV